jgi:hypothetical protein
LFWQLQCLGLAFCWLLFSDPTESVIYTKPIKQQNLPISDALEQIAYQ